MQNEYDDAPDGADDAVDAQAAEPTMTPLGWLAWLASRGEISSTEREAGMILVSLGNFVLSDQKGSARVSYNWRYPNGIWSIVFGTKAQAVEVYEKAVGALSNETRRIVVSTLVAREPTLTVEGVSALRLGLSVIARHWWGHSVATVSRKGVTLARTSADNDNEPTPERVAQGDMEAGRARNNFERLLVRGQIDEDNEVATALYAAGLRYESEHGQAFASGFNSPDYSKPIVDGGGADAVPITERAQRARDNLRRARVSMGRRYADVVDAVVLHGMSLVDAGRRHCGYKGTDAATTAAKERLNAGLRSLAVYYGIAVRRRAA